MFDDHWYQHTTTQERAPSLRRQDSLRNQSLAPRQSLERSRSNVQKKPQHTRKSLEIPIADVPRRPKSYSDLRSVEILRELPNGFTDMQKNGDVSSRPKSRNDMDESKRSRYGRWQTSRDKRRIIDLSAVRDELDFADWYGAFEDQLEDASNDEYRLFHATLESHLTTCEYLLSTTDEALEMLDGLRKSFITVEAQTSAFQNSCSSLLVQQNRLQSLADSIASNLQPFTELEPITRILARPGSDFVTTVSFRDMLAKLDRCLDWVNDPAHRSFLEVESYAPKFRHCMTRALTLIRNYYVSSVQDVANEVMGKMKERHANDNASNALLYAKFRVDAPLLRDLVGEIEKRCYDHEEYVSLLEECYSCHSSVRQKLVGPIIYKRLNDLSAPGSHAGKDLSNFARSAISFARSICLDEFELFYAYFAGRRGDSEVYNFLEIICEPLYDYLRPRIIHETSLVKLCELCSLIQTRYMRDHDDDIDQTFDRSQLDFGQLIQSTLHDTQTRIVFRTQAVIRDEIERFVPKPEDLDYPAKCQRSCRAADFASTNQRDPESPSSALPKAPVVVDSAGSGGFFDTETMFESMFTGWYPTLRKCIWLLSKIYRLVNSTVFDDLAHTIVHATTASLLTAAASLQKAKSSPIDANLFLIRHLLQLKSQIVAFDIEFVAQPDVNLDFSTLNTSFTHLRTNFSLRGLLDLVRTAALPKVVNNMIDAKSEIDVRLRFAINEFTNYWAGKMTEGIMGPSNRLAASDSPDPSARVKAAVERELPLMRKRLVEYLDDARTAKTFVGAVEEMVLEKYDDFYHEMFTSKVKTPRNVDQPWDGDMMAEWCRVTFQTGIGLEEDGGGSGSTSRAVSRAGSV